MGLVYRIVPHTCALHHKVKELGVEARKCDLEHQRWDFVNREMYVEQITRDVIDPNDDDPTVVNNAIRNYLMANKPTFNKCVSKFARGNTFEFQCKLQDSSDYLSWMDLDATQQQHALDELRSKLAGSYFENYDLEMAGSPPIPTLTPKVMDAESAAENADGINMHFENIEETGEGVKNTWTTASGVGVTDTLTSYAIGDGSDDPNFVTYQAANPDSYYEDYLASKWLVVDEWNTKKLATEAQGGLDVDNFPLLIKDVDKRSKAFTDVVAFEKGHQSAWDTYKLTNKVTSDYLSWWNKYQDSLTT